MNLNPLDEQLKKAMAEASELRASLESIRKDIAWYENTELQALADSRDQLKNKLKAETQKCNRLHKKFQQIQAAINKQSESINSLWNPKNWFDSQQRAHRRQVAAMKKLRATTTKSASTAESQLRDLRNQVLTKTNEIDRYKKFDFDAKNEERTTLEEQLSQQERDIERIVYRKQQLDAALEPIVDQFRDAQEEKAQIASALRKAKVLEKKLSSASNSYDRAMVHKECQEKFGEGSPWKVISKKESEMRCIDRDIEKLRKRAATVVEKAARDIRRLVIDGNNLCYQGDLFIGLAALRALVPVLAEDYDVVLVFDASIRRALGSGDADIRSILGGGIQVHVVATSIKADETVLDLAGSDKTTFIVSNDRFAEFGEKPAVRDRRFIRHEIVSGKVLVHDLGVSETFRRGRLTSDCS